MTKSGWSISKHSAHTKIFTVILKAGEIMKPSEALRTNREAIRQVVAAHRASNPRVFGSVVHGEDTEDSDLDILIDPTPETTLFDIGAIRHELLQLLGMPVDVLTPKALPEKFRAAVLAEARPV
jgi:predicted nucleotidyltransferase